MTQVYTVLVVVLLKSVIKEECSEHVVRSGCLDAPSVAFLSFCQHFRQLPVEVPNHTSRFVYFFTLF